jgi:hypothetical protein
MKKSSANVPLNHFRVIWMKFTSKNMDGFIKEIWNLTQEKKNLESNRKTLGTHQDQWNFNR